MIKEHRRSFKVLRLSFDLVLALALYFALYLGTLHLGNPLGLVLTHPDYEWRLPLLLFLAWGSSFLAAGVYDRTRLSPDLPHAFSLALRSLAFMLLAFTLGLFIFKIQFLSRKFMVAYSLACLGGLTLTKALELRLLSALRRTGYNTMSVVLLGEDPALTALAREFEKHEEWGYRVLGMLSTKKSSTARWLGTVGSLPRLLHTRIVDELILPLGWGKEADREAVLATAAQAGVRVRFILPAFMAAWDPQIDSLGGVQQTLELQGARRHPYKLMLKGLSEWLLALAALLLLSPLLTLLALAVLLGMGRPIFFVQKRAGRNGRVFNLYKFRSMVADARERQKSLAHSNEMDGPVFKLKRDPRVTWLGALLRKSSLDELPQLWNVLRGDMALVGPRAMAQYEARKVPAWAVRRFSVKPGITCLREVSGRSKLGFEAWMRSDLEYLDRWSLALDFKILLKTLPAVLSSKGAY